MSDAPRPFLSRCVLRLFLLGIIVPAVPAAAEIEAPAKPPRQAVPVTVTVERGGTVQVPLRIFGNTREQIVFSIRSQPALGTVSGQRVVQRDLSAITYSHSGEAGHDTDSFTYAAQSSDGVSAPARVTIRIIDAPSLLVAPDKLEFEPVVVGHSAAQPLTIINRGGGVARGAVTVEAPWKIDGDAVYALDPGAQATFPLIFDPPAARSYRGTIRYSSDRVRVTSLSGTGEAPFTIEPATLELRPSDSSRERSAALTLRNRLDTAQDLHLEIPEPIAGPASIHVPPLGSQTVKLAISADHLQAVSGEIIVRGDSYSAAIAVQAAAPPPRLEVEPGEIHLEATAGTPEPRARLTVLNSGGTRTFVRTSLSPPFLVAAADKAFTLEPGATREITVSLPSHGAGRFRAPIVFTGFETRAEATVAGEVLSEEPTPVAEASPRPLLGSPATAPAARAAPDPLPEPVHEDVAPPGSPDYIPAPKPKILDVTRNRATLAWEPPAEGPFRYVLEERILSLGPNGKLQAEWIPVSEEPEIDEAGRAVIRFERLRAGHPYSIRISAVKPDGSRSAASPPFQFVTKPPLSLKPRPLPILLLVAIILVAFVVRQRYFSRPAES